MAEESHWPFNTGDTAGRGARGGHAHDLDRDKSLQARQVMQRQKMRFDRFIVGGRAHAKKSGLS